MTITLSSPLPTLAFWLMSDIGLGGQPVLGDISTFSLTNVDNHMLVDRYTHHNVLAQATRIYASSKLNLNYEYFTSVIYTSVIYIDFQVLYTLTFKKLCAVQCQKHCTLMNECDREVN